MSRMLSPRRVCLHAVLCVLLVGCSSKDSLSVVPVHGKVSVDGQPVTSGNVSLIPVSADQKGGIFAGQIDSNGQYKIFTAGKEGAPAGKYKVTVTPSMVPTGGTTMPTVPFNAIYQDQKKTPLEMEVPNAKGYDLNLKK